MKMYISLVLFLPLFVFAENKQKSEHREHAAHVHGAATLAIAFDDLKGRVEFKAASEGVVGFEYQPKSEKDKKTLQETISKFEMMDKLIQFDSTLGCVFKKDKIEMVKEDDGDHDHNEHHGEHSNFVANFDVTCAKPILGSTLMIDFTRFSRLKDLDITVLVGSLQKSAEAKGKALSILLK